jgi:hypothetical protein
MYRLRFVDYYNFAAAAQLYIVAELHDCESEGRFFQLLVSNTPAPLAYELDFAVDSDESMQQALETKELEELEQTAAMYGYESANELLYDVVYSLNFMSIDALDDMSLRQKIDYERIFQRCVSKFLEQHEERCVEYFVEALFECA